MAWEREAAVELALDHRRGLPTAVLLVDIDPAETPRDRVSPVTRPGWRASA